MGLIKCILIFFLSILNTNTFSQTVKVEVIQKNGNWFLTRDSQPYYIKGAGGNTHLDELVAAGGNSIRIWSADDAQETLDQAHAHGLTVMFGLWVQHERHGYDYDNEAANKAQIEYFTSVVKKFKDHPALLMWSIGNEVDLFYSNIKVWDVVQNIAAMIHKIDPNHPTTTVTAGLDPEEVKLIQERAPDIDIYSINTYGEVCIIKDLIRTAGWKKPYIIAEWGPDGHWEVKKTKWSAPIEQTSHEKALNYFKRYNECIAPDKELCIGSYVFLWGQKQETTATWYGLFSEKGQSTEVIDYVTKGWSGNWPEDRAPSLDSLSLNKQQKGEDIFLIAEELYSADVYASDDREKVNFTYHIFPESQNTKSGGDLEKGLSAMPGLIKKVTKNQVKFRAPNEEGAYRLFVYASDNNNKLAYGNIPFYVNPRGKNMPQSTFIKLKNRQLTLPK